MSVRCVSSAAMNWASVMVRRSGVRYASPGSISTTGRSRSENDFNSVTTFQPGGKSRWLSTSRAVHSPGSSARSR